MVHHAGVTFREAREQGIDELLDVRAATRENALSRAQLAPMGITPASWLGASRNPATRAYGFYRALGWRPTGETDRHGDEVLVLSKSDHS
jgi:hypothetical protein